MKYRFLLIFVLILFSFDSCRQEKNKKIENGYRIIKKYYSDGRLKKEFHSRGESLEGLYVSYYENGKIKDSVNYHNNFEDGWYQSFMEDGNIDSRWYFSKGVVFGPHINYYKNGFVKEYRFIWKNGNDIIKREYDENGNLIEKSGVSDLPYFSMFILNDTNKLNVGDTLKCQMYIFRDPATKSITMKVNLTDGKDFDWMSWNKNGWLRLPLGDMDFEYLYENILTEKGRFFFQAALEHESSKKEGTLIERKTQELLVK